MKKIIPLLAVFLVFGFKHAFYLGVCDFKYNGKEKILEGSIKLFISDLENALTKLEGKKVDLIHPKDSLLLAKTLKTYLKKRLILEVNGQKLEYEYLGFEKEEEVCWLYLEAKKCPLPKKVVITNTLLYDFLAQQINIVNIEVTSKKKSLKVVNPETKIFFEL
jgi:hypothetical protein